MLKLPCIAGVAMILLATPVVAGESATKTDSTEPSSDKPKEDKDDKFAVFGFGVGIGVVLDIGSHDRINDAQIVNGIVRVSSDNNDTIRPMLESHVFFGRGNVVYGPFLGVQLTSGQVVDAIGAGIMIGFRNLAGDKAKGATDDERKSSLNFGVGFSLDPSIKTLGNGFVDDMAPPAGETAVRYRNRSQVGVLLMTSYGF